MPVKRAQIVNTAKFCSMFSMFASALSYINLFILLQNLPENFSDCKLKKKGLVKRVQVSFPLFFFLPSPLMLGTCALRVVENDSCLWLRFFAVCSFTDTTQRDVIRRIQ